ncbi:MAG TPA: hypothetical protein EYP23_06510 [Thermoplasmata archaeon]|nr:hypothetical protein [Thermoplasmata archaeon]
MDKIRDTATSLERIFVIEVMGCECGYNCIAGCVSRGMRRGFDSRKISRCRRCVEKSERVTRPGKGSWIIVVAEGKNLCSCYC